VFASTAKKCRHHKVLCAATQQEDKSLSKTPNVRNENEDVSNRLMCNNEESLLSNLQQQQVLASTVKRSAIERRLFILHVRQRNSKLWLYGDETKFYTSVSYVPNSILLFKTQNPAPCNSGKFDTDLINVQQNWQKENNLQIANREIYESERSRVNCMLKQHQTRCMSVQKSILERMMCAKNLPEMAAWETIIKSCLKLVMCQKNSPLKYAVHHLRPHQKFSTRRLENKE
jgi:hypothetical protein